MISDALISEKRRARAIAEDYRLQGYTVLVNPLPDQLPDFLADFHPDLVAYKASNSTESGAESVAVVVKAHSRLVREPQIAELAELLRVRPGWKLELALVENDGILEVPETAVAFEPNEIWGYHYEATKLLDAGFKEASVMMAWAAAEATVRYFLGEELRTLEEGDVNPERFSVHRLLGSAVYYGVITNADYSFLVEAKKQRDALAHGFLLPGVDPAEVARTMINAAKGLLEQGLSLSPE